MSQHYQPNSRRVRSALAVLAVIVTMTLAAGIGGLADHYQVAGENAATVAS